MSWVVFAALWVALMAILVGYLITAVEFASSWGYARRLRRTPAAEADAFLWVFLIPALNEEKVIEDSVIRLQNLPAANKLVVVIDDASTDHTHQILTDLAARHGDVEVVTRVLPHAQQGKSQALNSGYATLDTILSESHYQQFSPEQVIVTVVDADGQIDPSFCGNLARHFHDPQVGGVQTSIAINNQRGLLTRMQALEFEFFGGLFQAGRSRWGTAFMGGNGQACRLSALTDVAHPDEGPWTPGYLTEDQELGLRLLTHGWRSVQDTDTNTSQQGLNSLTRLWRQRTRWNAGNWQVVGLIPTLRTRPLLGGRRLDVLGSLVLPVLQIIVGIALVVSIIAALLWDVPIIPTDSPWVVVFYAWLAVGPLLLSVLTAGRGRGFWKGTGRVLLIAIPYWIYLYLMWPIFFAGAWKALTGSTVWDKTERE